MQRVIGAQGLGAEVVLSDTVQCSRFNWSLPYPGWTELREDEGGIGHLPSPPYYFTTLESTDLYIDDDV